MLDASILTMEWDEPVTVITFVERPWSGFDRWRSGGYGMVDGSWGPIAPIWPHADVDPLGVAGCRISAEAVVEGGIEARFCGECGSARSPGGRFCGSCGTAFAAGSAATVLESVRSIAASASGAGARLAAIVGPVVRNSEVSPEARDLILDLITTDFADPAVESLDVALEPDLPLTLRKAQEVRARLAAGGRLSPDEQEWARLLLTRAPLVFGYWGPFKALLKAGPLPGLLAEYGTALGRLARADAPRRTLAPVDVEDLGLLRSITTFPREGSFNYMRRRTRRDLATLGRQDPDAYIIVAEAMLEAWDEPLSSWAFAPAYVLRGRESLRAGSRRVDVSTPWGGRADPLGEIWNAHLGRVRAVFEKATGSPDAFTWAYQVLDDGGQNPRITPATLSLALSSRYSPLWEAACRMAPDFPEALASISEASWTRILRDLPTEPMAAIVTAFVADDGNRYRGNAAVLAARRALASEADSPDRLVQASRLYLLLQRGYWRPNATESADTLALRTVVAQGVIRDDEAWREVLGTVAPEALVTALWEAQDADPDVADLVADRIFQRVGFLDESAVLAGCMRHPGAAAMSLLWRIIDRRGLTAARPSVDRALTMPELTREGVIAFLEGALLRVPPMDYSSLLASVASSGVDITSSDVVGLLSASTAGRSALWEYLGSADPDWLTEAVLADPAAVARLGGDATAPQALAATALQADALRAYIATEPARLVEDPEFLVSAARSLDVQLQSEALAALTRVGHLSGTWLQLAESGMPACMAAARAFVESQRDPEVISSFVLACLDSQVAVTRQLGLDLLYVRQPLLDDDRLWAALSESDEPAVQRLVAEEALVHARRQPSADFDRRVLTMRRRSRTAKQAVMDRLDITDTGNAVEPDRVAALLNLARGSAARDRDWALARLAVLGLSGISVDGVAVSPTSKDRP